MTTTTRVDKKTELISTESITYMRAITLSISASLLKPNTIMYAYFNGINVNRYFTQDGKSKGEPLITDSYGNISATFDVPAATFPTGEKLLVLQDSTTYTPPETVGATGVFAKGVFTSSGAFQKFQTTETTVNTLTVTVVKRINSVTNKVTQESAPTDPLAQSFFTYGISGGCFITSIDLYFQSKDELLPVWVEMREMINGYPSQNWISPYAVATMNSEDVNVSNDATAKTNFKFDKLIYLPQDKDFCFVIRSNSNKYNVWTSQMGEKSKETGNTVFEQPYAGTMFKSENNFTWTAEQNQDIKFTLYKAEFNVNKVADLKFHMSANPILMDSNSFMTIDGTTDTAYVYASFPFKHGLDLNSKINIACDVNGTYNGIPGNKLNGTFNIFEVKSEYICGFIVPGINATVTGNITTGGLLKDIQIDNKGSGYDETTPPMIEIVGVGTGATAEAVIKNGEIVDINVTNEGSGYTSPPNIVISGVVGSGASATAITDSKFIVSVNRIYHALNPSIAYANYQNTYIKAKLKTTLAAFEHGVSQSYTSGKEYDVELNNYNTFDNNLLLASRYNEVANMANNNSAELGIYLSSQNKNVSPIIDLSESRMYFNTNIINNQKPNEVITSTNPSGYVTQITLSNGGSGYTSIPDIIVYGNSSSSTEVKAGNFIVGKKYTIYKLGDTNFTSIGASANTLGVVFTATGVGSGTGVAFEGNAVVATCTITDGVVDSNIIIHNSGEGFYDDPKVLFLGGNPTSAAYARATISDYNSEKKPDFGNAASRYITKKQSLASVSSGINLIATAYSNANSSFDVYIKTSLTSSGINHDEQTWELLKCDVERNKSKSSKDYLEYEFYLNDMKNFDMFSLKFVLRTKTPWDPPIIDNYRTVILAS